MGDPSRSIQWKGRGLEHGRQQQLGRRLDGVGRTVQSGYCRLQVPFVGGRGLGRGGGGGLGKALEETGRWLGLQRKQFGKTLGRAREQTGTGPTGTGVAFRGQSVLGAYC